MKILLAVGAPGAGHEAVFDNLVHSGVAQAVPSRRAGHRAQELAGKILRAQEVDPATQVPRQLVLGRLWQELATDLALANLEQPVWGWADHQSAWLLDFWQEFDPQVRLLLVYATPAEHLARALQGRRIHGPADVEEALRAWHDWNTVLLRYHQQHPGRTLLVNGRAAVERATELRQLLESRWGVAGLQEAGRNDERAQAPAVAVLAQAARALIPPDHAVGALEQLLHGAAQLPPVQADAARPDALATWNSLCDLVAEHRSQADQRAAAETALQAARASWGSEGEELNEQLRQAREALAAEQALRERTEAELAQLQSAQPALEALQQENQLLLVQLHQVQEELEQYFVKNQQLEADVAPLQQARAEAERLQALADHLQPMVDHLQPLVEQLQPLADRVQPLEDRVQAAEQEAREWSSRAAELEERCRRLEAVRQEMEQQRGRLEAWAQSLDGRVRELDAQWNELVQRPVADPVAEFEAWFWRTQSPALVTIDLRREVRGQQWHGSEADGRWSGPEPVSTLELPALAPGDYLVEVDIIDVIDQDLLGSLAVALQGRREPLLVEYLGEDGHLPAVGSALVTVEGDGASPLKLELHLARTVSPAAVGGRDERSLGVRVQEIRLLRQPAGAVAEDAFPFHDEPVLAAA